MFYHLKAFYKKYSIIAKNHCELEVFSAIIDEHYN